MLEGRSVGFKLAHHFLLPLQAESAINNRHVTTLVCIQ